MQFVVDRVSEDSFYANLLIGLPEVLQKLGIDTMTLERTSGLTECEILQWEVKNGVRLPEDLRDFYSACDGFKFSWYITTTENEEDDQELAGRIDIHPLRSIYQVFGYETKNNFDVELIDNHYVLNLGLESKLFAIETIEGVGRIILVYLRLQYLPTIWLYTENCKFYFLADDFTSYMRMSIAHLGIPEWQLTFTPQPVSETTLELFQIFIPHILPLTDKSEELFDVKTTDEDYPDEPINEIDPDFLISPCKTPMPPSQTKVVDVNAPSTSRKQGEKKKLAKAKPPTKFKRKPLYYIK